MRARLTFFVGCMIGFCGALVSFARGAEPVERAVILDTRFADLAAAGAWKPWSPRDEISPQFTFDPAGGRAGGALKITTKTSADFGAWRRQLSGIQPGKAYRFTAWVRAESTDDERRSIIPRLQWLDAAGRAVKTDIRPPEYVAEVAREGRWLRFETTLLAPETAAGLDMQLSLGFAAGASVWWDRVSLTEVAAPADRAVRVMTVKLRPRGLKSAAANVEAFYEAVLAHRDQKPDIICLPEGMTVVGTGKSYVDVSESIPGPTTERLGVLARELNSYIVAGIYEREAPVVYNTAVLIDRAGKVAGRYRKTHLPREEWEAGLTPGETYPTFETDFGRIGIMVCWDVQFPEPWRALGLQGAELVLIPIWGGNETLLQARAIENHAFVVSSGYDFPSWIVTPDGKVVGEATKESPVATAEIRLDRKIYQRWLGDMSTRTWKERRGDLPR
jgi:predicted amidohydrolase